MLIASLALAAVVYATPLPAGSPASLALAYADARRALDAHSDGFYLDDTAEGREALAHRWEAGAAWAAAELDADPALTQDEAATAALNVDQDLTLLRLDADTWLLGMGQTEGSYGAFAILSRASGRFRPAWTMWRDGAADARFPLLRAWSVNGARNGCRADSGEGHEAECGPLYARFGLLAPDAAGHERFYADAAYVQEMGATVGGQMSVWRWDGTGATPLVVDFYEFMLDQPVTVRPDGASLKVREKEEFRTFSSCGGCMGRQVDHIYAVTPDGLRDLGRVSVTPELDAIDAAFDRLHRNLPVDELAAPRAARVMESILRNTSEPGDSPGDFPLGMLTGDLMRRGARGATELCFSADSTDTYVFTLHGRAGRSFIAAVRRDPSGKCPGFPHN
ncbi:MAG TPA: hypothetical protein VMH86_04090 [Rhizomicrobium sp.]|nr:hypothetical protein [Rhizomicrobium sp.]